MRKYELLLKGGRVIDKQANLDGYYDILIDGGYIVKIAPNISCNRVKRLIDATDLYISPALIDLHTHIFPNETSLGLYPDDIGIKMGVNTVVDAGSSGALNYNKLKTQIIEKSDTEIYCFLNIAKYGLKYGKGELADIKNIDLNLNNNIIESNSQYIKGIKVRASQSAVGELGILPVKIAKKFAKEKQLPLMVHVGNEPPKLAEVLNLLEEGDIVTHIYHGKSNGIFTSNGIILDEVKDAYKRGIIFDVGHGTASFNFGVGKTAIKEGLKPSTISTDIHARNFRFPVKSLLNTMSKFLLIGLNVPDILECVSTTPAKILNIDNSIYEGNVANIVILSLEGDVIRQFEDSDGNKLFSKQYFGIKYNISKNIVTKY